MHAETDEKRAAGSLRLHIDIGDLCRSEASSPASQPATLVFVLCGMSIALSLCAGEQKGKGKGNSTSVC